MGKEINIRDLYKIIAEPGSEQSAEQKNRIKLPPKKQTWLSKFSLPAGMLVGCAGSVLALTSFLPYFHDKMSYSLAQAEQQSQVSIAQKDKALAECKQTSTQLESNNELLENKLKTLSSSEPGSTIVRLSEENKKKHADFAEYKKTRQVQATVEEVSALHRDKEALGRLNKEYSDLSLDYRNLEKSLNDYKITHPDAITEEACKKLESRFQQAREESQRSVDNYKETHPEEITSEKFYTLGRQFFAAETKLKNAEQVFSRYKATHPHTEDQYNALRATNTELATKIDEAKKQQTDPGSSGGDGNPAGLIIVVAIFVAIIAFITGGKK